MSQRIAQIRSNSTIIYHKANNVGRKELTDEQKLGLEKGKAGEYTGEMSKETKRKVKKMIDNFCTGVLAMKKVFIEKFGSSQINLTFVTLTLPSQQKHTDNEIKRTLLDHFLIICKRKYKHFEYFWRAEKQKNGNIHFHILTNYYIPHQWLKNTWNTVCEKLNYISEYSKNMQKMPFEEYYNKFGKHSKKSFKDIKNYYIREKKDGWRNPNSTDIHAVGKINNITNYVMKYVTKSVDEQKKFDKLTSEEKEKMTVKGRIWGASDSLKEIKSYELVIWEKNPTNLPEIYENRAKLDEINEEMCPKAQTESTWFTITDMNISIFDVMKQYKKNILQHIVNFHFQQTLTRYFGKFHAIHSLLTAKKIPFPANLF